MREAVWVILPTYNEAHNIVGLVERVRSELSGSSFHWHILIVDDNSPDGTGRLADALAERFVEVQVLHRQRKAGLGQAYIAGFEQAIDQGAGLLIEMDADFSHDPRDLKRLIEPATRGAAVVLGSRYVAGGAIENWPRRRRLISRLGCLYAQRILRVPVRDLTGGFKCFRAETLKEIAYREVRSQGYVFQVELTYRTLRAQLPVVEVPITFRERERGRSKMSAMIAIEAAWMVPALRWHHRSRLRR